MIQHTRLLIVEDDDALAKLLENQLRSFDCDVSRASSGEEALRMVENAHTPPDVVIMDMWMPGGMDGVDCARQLRHKNRDIMIIFMSADVSPAALERARSVSPTAYLLKDIGTPSAESFRAAVRLALDQREQRRHASQVEASNVRMKRALNMMDNLTQLYNRSGFNTLAPRYLKPGIQAVLYINLDNLTAINTAHGHEAGNDALRRFAKVLQDVFRADDLIARLSGDEFAVLAEIDEKLTVVKQRIHQELAIMNLNGGLPYKLEASVGAVLASPGQSLEELLSAADNAMLEEKKLHQSRKPKS